ncbi:TraB/GumN family protein [Alteraurantiacibacter aquimixticola]|uniref:TraB/GumN family protein n=1 Tax=Alteraurantiacibacter aquimixticola TaxID=2489173 RepID=A0A4V4U8J0_9SPHN|nr:TraB/GumN family protein [Alteraurantiacibacter aquimixticola]TIX50113.1 TraB/GumN family protein [Alteraurantiacibacter aquimixticola]
MIRNFIITFLGALWLAGCSAPDPLADHDWPEPGPALWEVEQPSTGNKAWLFGTVHALPDGVEWQSEAVEPAFAEARLLVVEIAGLGDSGRAAAEFNARAYSDALPPLLERVPAGDRAALAEALDDAGLEPASFDRTESWAVALTLSSALRSGDPANGVDLALMGRGKPLVGLESFASQYAIFDELPAAEQADLLLAVAREAREGDPVNGLEAWLTGDLARLEQLGRAGMLGDPELRKVLLDDRNHAWAAAIAQRLEAGEAPFVAVGAAHMLGESGLPALLADAGYNVRRIQ